MNKITEFNKTRVVDRTDPGFTIPGHKLRWINGKVSENNPGRVWTVLRKDILSPELVKHIEKSNPGAFSYGDTLRRGDLVLAYAPSELVDRVRAENLERAHEQEKKVNVFDTDKHGNPTLRVTNEASSVSKSMMDQFKKNSND